MEKAKKQKIFYNVILGIMISILVFSVFMLGKEVLSRKKEQAKFDELRELVTIKDDTQTQEEEEIETEVESDIKIKKVKSSRNISKLSQLNSDCIGWLCIPDTTVDYPVMYAPDTPQKYLRKNFYGEYSVAGVPFLDERCLLSNNNLIIYGHNMIDNTMFGSLKDYTESEYGLAHRIIEFETISGCNKYMVFAVVITDKNDQWYTFLAVNNDEELEYYIKVAQDKSLYSLDMPSEYENQLLTLSTCYGSNSNARLIVIACKVPENY